MAHFEARIDILAALADAIASILIEDLAQQTKFKVLRDRLRGDSPEKLALRHALSISYLSFCREYPELASTFFDEFFLQMPEVVIELSKVLTPNQSPDRLKLTKLWGAQFRSLPNINLDLQLNFFINSLESAVKSEAILRPFTDSRALDQLYSIASSAENQVNVQKEMRDLLIDIRNNLEEANSVRGLEKKAETEAQADEQASKRPKYIFISSSRLASNVHGALTSLAPDDLLSFQASQTNLTVGKQFLNEITNLIDLFENYFDEIATVLLESDIGKNFYGSAYKVSKHRLLRANRKLITISNDMRAIYRRVKRKFILTSKTDQIIDRITSICAQISIAEDFLVIKLLNNPDVVEFVPNLRRDFLDVGEMPDNLRHPMYLDDLGNSMLFDYHNVLIELHNHKLRLQEAIQEIEDSTR